jgi:L-proline amide hydrolase
MAMRSPPIQVGILLLAPAILALAACSGSTSSLVDSGSADAGDTDADSPDGFRPLYDSGEPPPDAGQLDTGPFDTGVIMEGVVEIHQLATYVKVIGTLTSTSPPIVFMHMGPGLAHDYLPPLYSYLASSRVLVFYDQRGEGRTSVGPVGTTTTAAFKTEQRARDAYDLIGWVQTIVPGADKVDVIAHGYGTVLAAMVAADHPEKIAHLVLSNPYPSNTLEIAELNAEANARMTSGERALYDALLMEPSCHGDVSGCAIRLWGLKGPHWLCPENKDEFQQLMFLRGDYRNQDYIEFYFREERYNLAPELARITAPAMIISGVCEPTPPSTAITYTASISDTEHALLDHSGYFPQVEEPDLYRQLVLHGLNR